MPIVIQATTLDVFETWLVEKTDSSFF
jgi:hypothetical protein